MFTRSSADSESLLAGGVSLLSANENAAEILAEELFGSGILISTTGKFNIILTESYLDPELATLNSHFYTEKITWMVVGTHGTDRWIGPLFEPDRGPCWLCLARRLQENGYEPVPSDLTVWRQLGRDLASRMLNRAEHGASSGSKLIVYSDEGETSHPVLARPQCRVCGEPGISIPAPWNAQAHGSLKTLVSPITGIVAAPEVTGARNGLVECQAALSRRNHRQADGTRARLRAGIVYGQGSSGEAAINACIAEAAERYSCLYHGDEQAVAGTAESIAGAIPLDDLLLISAAQYEAREQTNCTADAFQWLPERLEPDVEIEWSPVLDLAGDLAGYVPAAYCYLGHGASYCHADSNGCAAGHTFTDAVVRGMLELIERDAFALWWYNRACRPAVALDVATLPVVARGCLERLRPRIHVLDITTDLNVPTYVAISMDEDGRRVMMGSASDLDGSVALVRALRELCQTERLLEPGVGDASLPGGLAATLSRWLAEIRLDEQPYLQPHGSMPLRAEEGPVMVEERLLELREKLEGAGLRALVLNHTRPEIGIPVARVIVPGLRHFWARLAPGRLYEVPVSLGWQPRQLSETEMNPWSYFL